MKQLHKTDACFYYGDIWIVTDVRVEIFERWCHGYMIEDSDIFYDLVHATSDDTTTVCHKILSTYNESKVTV